MFCVWYVYKGKIYCDYAIGCDTEQQAIDGFDMAHCYDKVLLINVEKVNA